ncbi:MAG: SAM hydroxide adenosyltransferase [Planctomycetota bacterium]
MRLVTAGIVVLSLLLAGCSGKAATSPSNVNMTVTGKVTGISSEYGNAYTSIGPDRYDELNLSAGETVLIAFADEPLRLTLGTDYADVDPGELVAVLHAEGLTLAIRDGNFTQTHGIAVGDTFTLQPPTDER